MRPSLPLIASLLLVPAAAAEAAVADLTEPYTAVYRVTVDRFLVGKMERRLLANDGHLVLENALYTVGLVAVFKDDRFDESSEIQLANGIPQPQHYVYDYHSGSKQILEKLDFDWKAGTITSLRDGTTKTLPIQPGIQDKLSYQILLQEDLAAGKQDVDYQVAERHEVHDYRFHVMGEETLETPLGNLRCLKVERVRSNPKQAHTMFWAAIDMGYFLVQLRQDDDGHTYESRLLTLDRGKAAPSQPAH